MKIINLFVFSAAAACICGCGDNEARRFGYKGHDLDNPDERSYFSTGAGVTNWLPMRVLSVFEDYPISAEEKALVAAAGVVTPSESLTEIPRGYRRITKEPWFESWAKDAVNFDATGRVGFVAHFDEDKRRWNTGETYFSSYHPNKAAATVALAKLRKQIETKCPPKRFHDFPDSWAAEYLRLKVLAVVGQRADGMWTCMLDIRDKCDVGCGDWEPIDEQQERVDELAYHKAIKAWRLDVQKRVRENRDEIARLAKERGLKSFTSQGFEPHEGDGKVTYVRVGTFNATGDHRRFWDEHRTALEGVAAVKILGEPEITHPEANYEIWGVTATNDLYEVRLDMLFAERQGESADGQNQAGAPQPHGEWREMITERTLPAFAPPPEPKRP